MTTGKDWQAQVGRSWADNYRLTDRSFTGLTERLLERVAERDGNAVLDIGCGAGELSLAVARQRPGAHVVGVDLSGDLIAVARERASQHGNVRFVEGDAGGWNDPAFRPDVLMSRHGVMFFDDPVYAFTSLRTGAADAAELIFSCFRNPAENPWASDMARLLELPPSPDPKAPGPFAFADPHYVEDILTSAGWAGVGFEPINFAYIAGRGEDPIADALDLFRRIGPAAQALRQLGGAERERAEGWIRDWLAEHRSGDLVAFEAAAWIVTAAQ